MATDQNIGDICLKTIASTWQVDDSAIKWVGGGFDWSPGSHLVRVRAVRNEKEERWRVSVETDFLASVPIEDIKFIELTAALSGVMTSTYSMQYPPVEIWKETSKGEKPKLSLFSSVYVGPDLVEWLPNFFAQEAIVQVTNAEAQSVKMSEAVGGEPDFLPSGKNKNPDEILGVPNGIYVPEGSKKSKWEGTDEFVKFAENYGRMDTCFGNGDKSSLTLETPFGDESALIRLLSNVKHPQLGSGLLVTIQLPFPGTAEEIAKLSALLNFWEASRWTDFPQLGCWQPHDYGGVDGTRLLAHASFVPNVLHRKGLATNFAIWSVSRARWARQERWPELEDKPMNEIIEKRMLLAGKVTSEKKSFSEVIRMSEDGSDSTRTKDLARPTKSAGAFQADHTRG